MLFCTAHASLVCLLFIFKQCMKAGGGGPPPAGSAIAEMINKDFGSYDNFRKEFANAANTAFGSGWAWLVKTPSGLKVKYGLTDKKQMPS